MVPQIRSIITTFLDASILSHILLIPLCSTWHHINFHNCLTTLQFFSDRRGNVWRGFLITQQRIRSGSSRCQDRSCGRFNSRQWTTSNQTKRYVGRNHNFHRAESFGEKRCSSILNCYTVKFDRRSLPTSSAWKMVNDKSLHNVYT